MLGDGHHSSCTAAAAAAVAAAAAAAAEAAAAAVAAAAAAAAVAEVAWKEQPSAVRTRTVACYQYSCAAYVGNHLLHCKFHHSSAPAALVAVVRSCVVAGSGSASERRMLTNAAVAENRLPEVLTAAFPLAALEIAASTGAASVGAGAAFVESR